MQDKAKARKHLTSDAKSGASTFFPGGEGVGGVMTAELSNAGSEQIVERLGPRLRFGKQESLRVAKVRFGKDRSQLVQVGYARVREFQAGRLRSRAAAA
jgi:hypothetical protein